MEKKVEKCPWDCEHLMRTGISPSICTKYNEYVSKEIGGQGTRCRKCREEEKTNESDG